MCDGQSCTAKLLVLLPVREDKEHLRAHARTARPEYGQAGRKAAANGGPTLRWGGAGQGREHCIDIVGQVG